MPSLVTSVIGGIQGASAAHNAAAAAKAGYDQAGQTVTNAADSANTSIGQTVGGIAANVPTVAYNAGDTAMQYAGVNGAGVRQTAATGAGNVTAAGTTAAAGVSPYTSTGAKAAGTIGDMIDSGALTKDFTGSDLTSDPGYLFRLQQGTQAMNRSLAATGGANSGGAMKALNSYAQGVASDEFNNAFNRFQANRQNVFGDLATASGQGQSAAQYAGNAGIQTAENAAGQNNTASEFDANLNQGAAQYAGSTALQGSEFTSDAQLRAALTQGANTVNAGVYKGNAQEGAGQATAAGDIGAANSWNGMLSGIGSAANGAVMGGFGAGGGFNFGGMLTGNPYYSGGGVRTAGVGAPTGVDDATMGELFGGL